MNKKICLISAPFGPINMPSLGLTILKGIIEERGYSATIEYLGMNFMNLVGLNFYNTIAAGYPANVSLIGEFLFSTYFYNKNKNSTRLFVENYIHGNSNGKISMFFPEEFRSEKFQENIIHTYEKTVLLIPKWITSVAKHLSNFQAEVYAFTSMFQQNMSSLSIARELKKILPESLIIFGGANMEDPMGVTILEEYKFIDMVCSGEGENAFVSIIDFLESRNLAALHHNLRYRENDSIKINKININRFPEKTDINSLSTPDYSDYFHQLSLILESDNIQPRLLIETSRGCWWGEKCHCSFCGLNGSNLSFRSKCATNVLQEIKKLHKDYPSLPISVVDNILDYKYFDTLLPKLIHEESDLDLFFETRANLNKTQLKLMKDAGISRIQPGIESLSTAVLKIMKKWVQAIQNIYLLKLFLEIGIRPEWNLIWGFPGENPIEYSKIKSIIPFIKHFQPPAGAGRLRLDRFSPLYENKENEYISNVRPHSAYYNVYEISESKLHNLSYYFEFDYQYPVDVDSYTNELSEVIAEWKDEYQKSYLVYIIKNDEVLVFDGRYRGAAKVFRFNSVVGYLLQQTENPISLEMLMDGTPEAQKENAKYLIDELIKKGILLLIDNHLLNIATDFSVAQSNKRIFLHLQVIYSCLILQKC